MTESGRRQIAGRGIPVPGNDIDTDRIIPARFLKTVTNEGLGLHAFEDARKHDPEHPFNQKVYEGASVLVAGLNFGCGSSREHAPESLKQWGIKAIVAGSFAEIFFGNCTMLGIPCMSVDNEDVLWLQRAIGRDLALDQDLGFFATGKDLVEVEARFLGRRRFRLAALDGVAQCFARGIA